MDRRDELRAADADREAVAERLRAAVNEGRLDLHEYDDRLQRAYAARTYGELDVLLTDLPGAVPAERAQLAPVTGVTAQSGLLVGPDGRNPQATRRWLAENWSGYLGTVGITVAIWTVVCVMSRDLVYFWPGWVAGPWGAVLLVSTISGLMSGEPQKWAAKRARKEQEKADKRVVNGSGPGGDG